MNPGQFQDGIEETPREVQRFRKDRMIPVGKPAKHWGVANDANYPPEGETVVFGRKNRMEDSVSIIAWLQFLVTPFCSCNDYSLIAGIKH